MKGISSSSRKNSGNCRQVKTLAAPAPAPPHAFSPDNTPYPAAARRCSCTPTPQLLWQGRWRQKSPDAAWGLRLHPLISCKASREMKAAEGRGREETLPLTAEGAHPPQTSHHEAEGDRQVPSRKHARPENHPESETQKLSAEMDKPPKMNSGRKHQNRTGFGNE